MRYSLTKGEWMDPHTPLGREEMASSAPPLQSETRAALASTNKKCPLPTDFCSANVASRAQITFPWNPCPWSTNCAGDPV